MIAKRYSSSVIYCIMSYFETVLFKQSSTISATSQAEDRQVRITNTCQKSHCAIEDDQPLKCFVSILRVRASFNLAIESRRKQFDK
ncbi:hypothetical protein T05_8984 [Trichinella murrelli]|uniref:Uncharacterized protein n=1 Tax=Trichinella murrelli TaxID=144512 RepID=A0A0V0UCF6_9BILA|nr:hypothetical protein T05_10252 [Trichinella murrelli]KRX44774.1 hypothetical protein T05_927 [Trichinella murrelli]KRX49070.1 hypothetical protein T05_8984 [Trichinella murrelli]